MTSVQIVQLASLTLDQKKAEDIRSLYIRELTVIADYFVLARATSNTHAKTLADEVENRLEAAGVPRLGMEGYATDSGWILQDFGPVMVHIFYGDTGAYDNLCRLWADGKEANLLDSDETTEGMVSP